MSDDNPKLTVGSLLDKLAGALIISLAGAIVFLLTQLGSPILDALEKASTKEFLLRLSGILGFAVVVAVAYILHLRSLIKKPLTARYRFKESGGYYIDRKTGAGVCTKCL